MFKKSLPNFGCYELFARFVDIQDFYLKVIKKKKGGRIGLSMLVEQVLGANLCKGEQMSNWELRPLRKT